MTKTNVSSEDTAGVCITKAHTGIRNLRYCRRLPHYRCQANDVCIRVLHRWTKCLAASNTSYDHSYHVLDAGDIRQ